MKGIVENEMRTASNSEQPAHLLAEKRGDTVSGEREYDGRVILYIIKGKI